MNNSGLPIFWCSSSFIANNGDDYVVTMKTSYSRSVKKTIKSELGINTSKNDTNIASSISASYETTASYESQYETSYRFKMDQYPTDCFYKAAAFGYVVKYLVQKKSFFSSYSYYKNCYTFKCSLGISFIQ